MSWAAGLLAWPGFPGIITAHLEVLGQRGGPQRAPSCQKPHALPAQRQTLFLSRCDCPHPLAWRAPDEAPSPAQPHPPRIRAPDVHGASWVLGRAAGRTDSTALPSQGHVPGKGKSPRGGERTAVPAATAMRVKGGRCESWWVTDAAMAVARGRCHPSCEAVAPWEHPGGSVLGRRSREFEGPHAGRGLAPSRDRKQVAATS